MSDALRVAIVGCGLIGRKRAESLGPDFLVGCFDAIAEAASALVRDHGGTAVDSFDALLALEPDVVVVAVTHDQLAELSVRALRRGAHVLVEKPAAVSAREVDAIAAAAATAGRLVKVGFNHRFHPGLSRAVEEAHSGRHGDVMHTRARYGHGGRPGYEYEWRAEPERSGGGELVDQGIHLLDLCHWLLGPLPLHSALLRTQYWNAPVDDNAALILGDTGRGAAPWAMLHASWTEWKNLFSLEIYCRTAKLQVDGLVRSYGPQTLRIYTMRPELGPPHVDEITYTPEDQSWAAEWRHFREAVVASDGRELLGDLTSARYAWSVVEAAYELGGYADMRARVG